MANQFANNHDLDDLPATPTDAPYTPPRGIMASASNTGSKRKRSSPGSVEGEPSPIRQRVPTTNQPAPIAESNDLEALLARRDQLRRAMSMKTVIALSDTSDDTMQAQELLSTLESPATTAPASAPSASLGVFNFLPFVVPTPAATNHASPTQADANQLALAVIPSVSPVVANDWDLLSQLIRTPFKVSYRNYFTARPYTLSKELTLKAQGFAVQIEFQCEYRDGTTTSRNMITSINVMPHSRYIKELRNWCDLARSTNDIAAFCYGLGQYYNEAVVRAKTLSKASGCFIVLPQPEFPLGSSVAPMFGRSPEDEELLQFVKSDWENWMGKKKIVITTTKQYTPVMDYRYNLGINVVTGEVERRVYVNASYWDEDNPDDDVLTDEERKKIMAMEGLFLSLLILRGDVFDAIYRSVDAVFA